MKKGFTLIELLAVIVILAIIALIATPIILNIINESKIESKKRSAENYIDAVEQIIVRKNVNGEFNPTSCEISGKNLSCKKGNEQLETIVIDIDGEVPSNGTIKFHNGSVTNGTTMTIGSSLLIKNNNKIEIQKENKIIIGEFNSICKIASDSAVQGYEAGAKYNCKVDPNKDTYTFYVLKTPSTGSLTIDLIMDQNINSDGTPAGITGVTKEENPQQYNLLAWFNEGGVVSNEYGPVTAINFLYNATKNWTNVLPLNFEYKDKEEQGVVSDVQIGYTSFKSENGILTITGKTTTKIGTNSIPLRARLPIYSNNVDKVEVFNKTDLNYFLYDNLKEIGVPNSYWLLSSYAIDMPGGSYAGRFVGYAYLGSFVGRVLSTDVTSENGVRPVITLEI